MNQSTFFADSQASTAFVQRISDAYAFATAALANLLSPAAESPAEAASRLRSLAEAYSDVIDRFLGAEKPLRFIEAEKVGFFKRLFGGK